MKSETSSSHLIASNLNIQRKIAIILNITQSLKLLKVLEAVINFDYFESLDENRDRKLMISVSILETVIKNNPELMSK